MQRSALLGRLVIATDAEAARAELAGAGRSDAHVVSTGLFGRGFERLWHNYNRQSDVGLAHMVGPRPFLAAMRRLADDLLQSGLLDTGAAVLVDAAPEYADPRCLAVIGSLFPDAVLAGPGDLASQLPDPTRLQHAEPEVDAPSPMQDRLIVILGCGRSGTTWLEDLLLAHPDAAGVADSESWLFHQLHPLWGNLNSAAGLQTVTDDVRLATAVRRFADSVFADTIARHRPGASHVVEKTPMHAFRLDEIRTVYPDAWVIHLVRDGRDVARSISQTPFFEIPDPGDAAALWSAVLHAVRSGVRPRRWQEVRYESLAADPVGVVGRLFDWVGLSTDSSALEAVAAAAPRRVSTHAGTQLSLGSDTWRGLPRAAIRQVHRRAGDCLVREGYATRGQVWRGRLLGR